MKSVFWYYKGTDVFDSTQLEKDRAEAKRKRTAKRRNPKR